jgi:hypothetical protein
MPITDQFWQYAKEAMLLAYEAKSDEDKKAFLDLARTWALAAITERHAEVHHTNQLPSSLNRMPLIQVLSSLTPSGSGMSKTDEYWANAAE